MKKMSPKFILLTTLLITLVTVFPAAAGTVTICNFDDQVLNNYDPVSAFAHLYSGVTFSGDTAVCVAVGPDGYNYDGFPPHSGYNVIAFHGPGAYGEGKLIATFTQPASKVGVWYVSMHEVYLDAYDKDGNLIKTETSPASSYGGPEVYFEVTAPQIASVAFHDQDGTMVMDDFTFETADDVNVPEFPSIAIPVAAVLGLILVFGRRKM
jgi:hypothetical protein